MIVLKVAFVMKDPVSEEDEKKRLAQLVDVFRQVPGLKRKYFIADPKTGEAGGIYAFESQQAVDNYLQSDVWQHVRAMAQGEPRTETFILLADTDIGVL